MDDSSLPLRLQQAHVARWLVANSLLALDSLENALLDAYVHGQLDKNTLLQLLTVHEKSRGQYEYRGEVMLTAQQWRPWGEQ